MTGYFVYFYYGKDDELLYVGQSVDVGRRWKEHTEHWKNEVCKVGVREYPDSASMDIFEYYYITRLSPKYNIARLHRGATTFEIPDSTTLNIYNIEDFLKKYTSYIPDTREEKYLTFEEELIYKGKIIVDVDEVNLFDKKWNEYDLDRIIFRYGNIYLSTFPFLFNTYGKTSSFKTSNYRVECLYTIMNIVPVDSVQKLTITECDDSFLVKTAKTACNLNPLFVEVTHQNIRTGQEDLACSFSLPIFDSSITYNKEHGTTSIDIDLSKIQHERKYIKALNADNFIIDLTEIFPTIESC